MRYQHADHIVQADIHKQYMSFLPMRFHQILHLLLFLIIPYPLTIPYHGHPHEKHHRHCKAQYHVHQINSSSVLIHEIKNRLLHEKLLSSSHTHDSSSSSPYIILLQLRNL